MPKVTPDKRPAYYSGPITVNWTFDSDVTEVAFNENGIPPAISKYIAYDTLNPPNPFIAVTQDGRGNVVYDGGFPKFYNHRGPSSTNLTFSQLNASFKYLYNALNFVANPDKVAVGNRKVLLLGDATGTRNYRVKGTATSDFRTSFERLAAIAGYTITIKDSLDYGSALDARLSELDQYCCVIYMSSRYAPDYQGSITDACVSDLASYRHQGNGLIIITDHGNNVSGLENAYAYSEGFFVGCNRLITNFGAYFTGDFDRTSVNVGFLRANYGDHPLYNGMADSEYISAGGSESKVVVTEVPTSSPTTFDPTVLDAVGQYELNFLMLTADGGTETVRYAYTIGNGNFLYVDAHQGPVDSGVVVTPQKRFEYPLLNTKASFGTLQGYLEIEDYPVAEFSVDDASTGWTWYAGETVGFPIGSIQQSFTLRVTTPVLYFLTLTAEGRPPRLADVKGQSLSPASLAKLLATDDYSSADTRHRVRAYAEHAMRSLPTRLQENALDYARQRKAILQYLKSPTIIDTYVYDDLAAFTNARDGLSFDVVTVVVRESVTGAALYRRSGSGWERLYDQLGFRYLFGYGSRIRAINSNVTYRLSISNEFTVAAS